MDSVPNRSALGSIYIRDWTWKQMVLLCFFTLCYPLFAMLLTFQAVFPTVDDEDKVMDVSVPDNRTVDDVYLRGLSSLLSSSRSLHPKRESHPPLLWSWS